MFQSNLLPIISTGSGEKVDFDGFLLFLVMAAILDS